MEIINGYKVFYLYKNEPITRVESMIKAGTFAEFKEISGISHLLEHILMDSWGKCVTNCTDYWKKKGISSNAHTSPILVSYHITGLNNYNEEMIDYISSIITNPIIRDQILKKEILAVRQELMNFLNDPSWKFENIFNQTIFPNTECGLYYGEDWNLQLDNLSKITVDDLYEFHKKWYTPDNLVFTVITNESFKSIKKYFKKYLKNDRSNRLRQSHQFPIIEYPVKNSIFVKRSDAEKVTFKIAFVSDIKPADPENLYMDLIKDILVGDLSSFLTNILREEMGLIYSISLNFTKTYENVISLFEVSTDYKNKDLLINTFEKLIQSFLDGDFDDFQIDRAKERLVLLNHIASKNANFYGKFYGHQLIFNIDLMSIEEMLQLNLEISKSDLVKISKRIFTNCVIGYEYKKK